MNNSSTSLSNVAAARPTTLEFNDSVWSVAAAADGTKYLGGDFTRVGLTSGQAVALDALSGRPSVAGFPIIGDGGVTAAAPDGAGGWYIGGDFRRVGEAHEAVPVHMRADGSVDPNWNPVPNSAVNAIAVMNGVVYIAGTFTAINGQQRLSLAAIDAASGQLMAWNPVPEQRRVDHRRNERHDLRRRHVHRDRRLLPQPRRGDRHLRQRAAVGPERRRHGRDARGGRLDGLCGRLLHHGVGPGAQQACRARSRTGKPTAWNASLVCGGCEVRALAVYGTTLYVGGRFPQIGSAMRNSLAAVDARNAASCRGIRTPMRRCGRSA